MIPVAERKKNIKYLSPIIDKLIFHDDESFFQNDKPVQKLNLLCFVECFEVNTRLSRCKICPKSITNGEHA